MCITTKINFQEIETKKEDTTEQFHHFKNDFLDEFSKFKTKFPHKGKSFKDNILNTTPKNTGNMEHIRKYYVSKRLAAPKRKSYRFINQSIFITK